jgi:hypothetical protein
LWWVFDDEFRERMFTIEFSHEGTGIALPVDFLSNDTHVHFRQFAFGTADVFFDEFVQHFTKILFTEVAIYDVVRVVLAACFFERSGGSFLESEKL